MAPRLINQGPPHANGIREALGGSTRASSSPRRKEPLRSLDLLPGIPEHLRRGWSRPSTKSSAIRPSASPRTTKVIFPNRIVTKLFSPWGELQWADEQKAV